MGRYIILSLVIVDDWFQIAKQIKNHSVDRYRKYINV